MISPFRYVSYIYKTRELEKILKTPFSYIKLHFKNILSSSDENLSNTLTFFFNFLQSIFQQDTILFPDIQCLMHTKSLNPELIILLFFFSNYKPYL